jgi:hypothetical protein
VEGQNDERLEGLLGKVKMLKDVSLQQRKPSTRTLSTRKCSARVCTGRIVADLGRSQSALGTKLEIAIRN